MKYLKYSAMLLVLLVSLAAGCGEDGDNKNTGPTRTCGAGTVLNPLSECVPDGSVMCAEGTVEVGGKCVASEEVCGENTVWQDGKCVPAGDGVVCGEGTTFSEDTGRCMPDVVCGPGTTAVGGVCLSDEEVLTVDVDAKEAAGQNDPAFGGSPQALTMPAAGDSYLLLGTIEAPTDHDGDGTLDQDVDVYTFEAQGSDFVRVHLHQLAAGSFGFEVRGPNGYYREGPRNSAGPARSLLLPSGGTYEIRVQPQATMFEPDAGPVGGDDHRYLLVLENVGGLDLEGATLVDASVSQVFSASFQAPEEQLFQLLSPAETAVRLRPEQSRLAGSAQPVLMMLDEQGQVVQEFSPDQTQHLMRVEEENSRFVYVDYVRAASLEEAVQVHTGLLETTSFPAVVLAGGSAGLQASGAVLPGSERYFAVEVGLTTSNGTAVPQGVVAHFSLTRTVNRPAELTVYSPDSQVVTSTLENNILFYAEKAGVYLVELKNLDELNTVGYSDLQVATHVPVNLEQLNTTTRSKQTASFSVAAQSVQFFTFEATEALVAQVSLLPAMGQAPTWMDLSGTDMRPLASAAAGDLKIDRQVIASPQRRVGALYNNGSGSARGLIEVASSALPVRESEPNDTRGQADVLSSESQTSLAPVRGRVQGQDVDVFKVRLEETALVVLDARLLSGSRALKVQLLDASGKLIEQADWRGNGLKAGAVLQKDTDYYLQVSTETPGEVSEYAVFASVSSGIAPGLATLEAEPNENSVRATRLPAGALEMIGTLGGYTDADWFEIELAQARWVRPVWQAIDGVAPTHDAMNVMFFAADGVTVLDYASAVRLPAGKSFVQVSSAYSMLQGNTYYLELADVAFEPLGTLHPQSSLEQRDEVFAESGLAGYSFTLMDALPVDGSQAVFVWASEQTSIHDEAGNLIFVGQDSGQTFGTAADPSFYAQALEAGTYYVTVQRDFKPLHDVVVGRIAHRQEAEASGTTTNGMIETAELLGSASATQPLHVLGSVSAADGMDHFEFVVPGNPGDAARPVTVELFQIGETVADMTISLHDETGHPLADAHSIPMVMAMDLAPGRYFVRSWFLFDVGAHSGEYLLRVSMEP